MKNYIEFIKPIELWDHDVLGVTTGNLIFRSFIQEQPNELAISTLDLSLKQIESLLLAINLLFNKQELTMREFLTLKVVEKQISNQINHAASKSGMNKAQIETIEYCLTLFQGSNLNQNISRIRLFLLAESILRQKI